MFNTNIATVGKNLDKDNYMLLAASYAPLKRVQYGTYTFSSGGTSTTATLANAVDTSKAVLIHLGFSIEKGSTTGVFNLPRITLTNSTTVTADRVSGIDSASSNVAGTGSFVVMEFN